jgi:hypothetical protein
MVFAPESEEQDDLQQPARQSYFAHTYRGFPREVGFSSFRFSLSSNPRLDAKRTKGNILALIRKVLANAMRNILFFSGLSPEEVATALGKFEESSYGAGTITFSQDYSRAIFSVTVARNQPL